MFEHFPRFHHPHNGAFQEVFTILLDSADNVVGFLNRFWQNWVINSNNLDWNINLVLLVKKNLDNQKYECNRPLSQCASVARGRWFWISAFWTWTPDWVQSPFQQCSHRAAETFLEYLNLCRVALILFVIFVETLYSIILDSPVMLVKNKNGELQLRSKYLSDF